MTELQLSERQQTTVAAAVTLVCAVIILVFVATVFWFLGYMVSRFSSVLLPLAFAAILALVLKPYHRWISGKLGQRRLAAVLVVYLSILVPVGVLGYFFGAKIVEELSDLVSQIPVWWEKLSAKIELHLPALKVYWTEHGWGERTKELFSRHGSSIFKGVGDATEVLLRVWTSVFRSVTGLFGWVMLPIYLAFFLMAEKPINREQFEDLLPFLKKDTAADVIYLGEEFISIVVSFFRGQFLVALCQGLLFAAGFALIGLKYGFSLGLVLGFLNIIPYLGSMVGLGVCLPLAFTQEGGGALLVLLVAVVFTIVQCIEGYLLTPKIMGDRTGLHPLVIMVAIFFWGSAFGGITGMVLAIPLTAFLVVFWRLAKSKYIKAIL